MGVSAKHILLIAGEREENSRLLAAAQNTLPGSQVLRATPATALQSLRGGPFDLLLYAFEGGLADGRSLNLLKEICLQSPEVPLVALLPPGEDMALVRALRDGVTSYVTRDEVPSPRFERAVGFALQRSQRQSRIAGADEAELRPRATPASSRHAVPLSQSDGDTFRQLGAQYEQLLERSIDRQSYRSETEGNGMEEMARRLGELRAGPRDVIDLHSAVLKKKYNPDQPSRYHAYAREARLLLLELMGYLVGFYRGAAFPAAAAIEERAFDGQV